MLFDQPCAIVDLETTGGHITRDRITEVGVILIDNGTISRFETLVNPGQAIPPFIEKMTGISDAMVASAPSFADIAQELLLKLQGRLFLAHNARFDYGFLKNEFRRAGLGFQSKVLCTVKLSRRLYPEHFKHNLDSIIQRHGIRLSSRHRAMADAEAVYQFIHAAQAELGEPPLTEAVQALLAQPDAPLGLDPELVDALPDVPGVYLLRNAENKPLYVGKGSNIRQAVFSHFKASSKKGAVQASQIKDITWHETIGDFGAALQEILQIRQNQPVHNYRHKLNAEYCSIQLGTNEQGYMVPRIVFADDIDFGRTADLYGLFRSAREARKALLSLAASHKLCQAVLGVETVTSPKGSPCAGVKAGTCREACTGKEPPMQHNTRLISALARVKVKNWPFPAPVAVVETDEVTGESAEHVFDRWCYLGTRSSQPALVSQHPVFDLDIYKLLDSYLRKPVDGTALRLLDGEV